MATLTRKPKPEPIDPEALYESVSTFSVGNDVYRQGVKIRGDNPAVTEHRALFMPADLDDLQKAARRRAHKAHAHELSMADRPQPAPPPTAEPPSGRFRAVKTLTLADPDLAHRGRVNAGETVDADDEVYRRYPHLFVQVVEER